MSLIVDPQDLQAKALAHIAANNGHPEIEDLDPAPPSRFDFEIHDFINQPEPDYQWLIPNIAERGDRIILTGPEGGGKSTLLRQIAVQVAAGVHPFTLEAIPPRRTLLIDLENGRRHLRRSLRPLTEAAHTLQEGMSRVICLPSGIDLLNVAHIEWLQGRMEIDRPEIVIVGPIYKMANGDPTSEEVAKRVAYTLDELRNRHECALLIEAHQPYASNGSSRPERPYGASLWSRWPEFGLHISTTGQLRHWRGDRDERAWPKNLQHGTPWPWEVAQIDDNEDDEKNRYDGPSHCREAIVEFFAANPDEELSQAKLQIRLRALNKSYRASTIGTAAEQLVAAGSLNVRTGPRNARLFSYHRSTQNDPTF